jgi:adenylylsulfate kinase-like enzyme
LTKLKTISVSKLELFLKDGYIAASKVDSSNMEKVVIFLGFTGSGKSTVAKFILKDPTLKIKEDMQVMHK